MIKRYFIYVAFLITVIATITISTIYSQKKSTIRSPKDDFVSPQTLSLPNKFKAGAFFIYNTVDGAEKKMWFHAIVHEQPYQKNDTYFLPLKIYEKGFFNGILGKSNQIIGLSQEDNLNPSSTPRTFKAVAISEVFSRLKKGMQIAIEIDIYVDEFKMLEKSNNENCGVSCKSRISDIIANWGKNLEFQTLLETKNETVNGSIGPIIRILIFK